MSHTQKRRRASHTRCARRSLVELTAAASRAVDDGLFVLSSGIAASNPRSEHTGDKTSDQTILARQATAPSPVAVLESRNAAAPRKDELLDSDTTTEMMVKIAKDYQNRAFENINASLNAALDHAKDLVETRVGGEAASKDIGGFSLESKLHLYAALAEKERRLISERTRGALAAKKAGAHGLATRATWFRPGRLVERRWSARQTNLRRA